MPRGRGGGGFSRGYGMGYGRGYGFNPHPFCRWFPWLPRRWWAYPSYRAPQYATPWIPTDPRYSYNAYTQPYTSLTPYSTIPKEQEITMLEEQVKLQEKTLEQIRKRLKELKKEE